MAQGSPQLLHSILATHGLLQGMCDAVLAEGACEDRWHDVRVVRCEAGASGPRSEKAQVAKRTSRAWSRVLIRAPHMFVTPAVGGGRPIQRFGAHGQA